MPTTESRAFSHVGRRDNNEDAFYVSDALGLFVVADGMGGYEGGEVASDLAISTIREFFEHRQRDSDETWPFGFDDSVGLLANMLTTAVRMANSRVVEAKRGVLGKMGSTVVSIAVGNDELAIAHVGDSRVYRFRDGTLKRMTRDHSLSEEMGVEGPDGEITPDTTMRNVLTRALGMPDVSADVRVEKPLPGDMFLLCSDGLLESLSDADIAARLQATPSVDACEGLVEAAYEAGGRDNITVALVRIGD